MVQLTGIVLAGGKSSRMGKDKALLSWGNYTLLEHTVNKLSRVCSQVVISSNEPAHQLTGHPLVPDLFPGLGPLSGIYSVMKNSNGRRFLVLSVDLPMVHDGLLQYMSEMAGKHPLVVPVHKNGRLEPTCAVYGKKLMPWLEKMVKGPDYSLKSLFSLPFCRQIPEKDYPEWFLKPAFENLNTLKDYETYRKRK